MGLADLHMHTIFSYDGTAPVPAVLRRAHEGGLDVIAITDHDVIEGALLAVELAPHYGVEVIPGIEVTTADGDLLALNVRKKIRPGRSLIETVMHVRDLGGFCIAPHPSAGGMGMKSLSIATILKALHISSVADTLIGIEAYNATALDRVNISTARLLTSRTNLTSVGNSDAHVLGAIGLGATEFPGKNASDLLSALRSGQTSVRRLGEWSNTHILGTWALNYIGSAFTRLAMSLG